MVNYTLRLGTRTNSRNIIKLYPNFRGGTGGDLNKSFLTAWLSVGRLG